MTRISLGGSDWQVKGYEGEDWRWRNAHMPDTRDVRHWIPAAVPGSIHHDLWAAGQISDPYFERNSLLIEWIPARTWVYRKTFVVDAAVKGQRALLRFEGVDYDAQFFLNGRLLGRHAGMYTPAVFEVGDLLNDGGENLLAVVVEAAPHEQPQVGRTSLVRTHKSRMTYWWDFCPRMIHLGIWDDVSLEFSGPVRIADAFVRPRLHDDFSRADVSVAVTLDAAAETESTVEIIIRLDDETVAKSQMTRSIPPGTSTVDLSLTIDSPRLWYPNGAGSQPLYSAEISLAPASPSQPSALAPRPFVVRFGIRRVEFVANEGAPPDARPYTLVVNGQRTYIKGWNWVPIDVMYGVPRPEKLDHLLTLARRAHVNVLRIWGGGLIETKAFYDRCDELGILVWQEFIMSSSGIDNNPPSDPSHIDVMTREAEQIIPRRRNHPSLAIWCGGNELQGDDAPLDDSHPLLGALKAVVARLDPDRFWLPTSPTGPVFQYSLENIERDPEGLHDVHGPWEYQGVSGQYTLYNNGTSLLHSEFGVEGITNKKTLDATIAPEHQLPVSLDNPLWQHLGAWWVKGKMWRETFGDLSDVESLVRATQLMQAEGLRYALEADRRRKYRNSGTLPWQFNEPYPMAACTSAVDYYGQPKPSYYAVARAYAPLLVSARVDTMAWAGRDTFEAEIWVNRSAPVRHAMDARVRHAQKPGDEVSTPALLHARIIGSDGTVYGEWDASVIAAPDSAQSVYALAIPLAEVLTDVFFLDLVLNDEHGAHLTRNRYPFAKAENLSPLLAVARTPLEVAPVDGGLTVTNVGRHAAMFVWLEDARGVGAPGYGCFADNHFCLLPDEARTTEVEWRGVEPADRKLSIRGWNTNEWKG